jgi:ABC-type nickel/cobalt efflux system permease component RcnA
MNPFLILAILVIGMIVCPALLAWLVIAALGDDEERK